jgi:hypothetical protein
MGASRVAVAAVMQDRTTYMAFGCDTTPPHRPKLTLTNLRHYQGANGGRDHAEQYCSSRASLHTTWDGSMQKRGDEDMCGGT